MRYQNYLALDLELNNKNDGTTPKIIQVGVSFGSPKTLSEFKTYSWYLDPKEDITPFITQLTGIDNQTIKEKAVSHELLAEELGNIINENNCFVNPVCWGGDDALELKAEFTDLGINFPFFGRRIIDVKTIYVFNQIVRGRTPSGGLRKSMNSYGMKFQGTPHRADNDALNTLHFFFFLLKRQETVEDTINLFKML